MLSDENEQVKPNTIDLYVKWPHYISVVVRCDVRFEQQKNSIFAAILQPIVDFFF